MRCEGYTPNKAVATAAPIKYTCGKCSLFYNDQHTLLEHLYWRHGTESQICPQCCLKKWSFAAHICHYAAPVCVFINEDSSSSNGSDSQYFSDRGSRYCYCGRDVEGSDMIACDSGDCRLEWFHFECVGVVVAPLGKWYCPDCSKHR